LIPTSVGGTEIRAPRWIDAKYMPLEDAHFPNADAYQMLAYCTAFGLSHGYLVYARDALEHDRQHRVRNGDVTIDARAIDVELEPDLLLDRLTAATCGCRDSPPTLRTSLKGVRSPGVAAEHRSVTARPATTRLSATTSAASGALDRWGRSLKDPGPGSREHFPNHESAAVL
jgi:hypothetical protein